MPRLHQSHLGVPDRPEPYPIIRWNRYSIIPSSPRSYTDNNGFQIYSCMLFMYYLQNPFRREVLALYFVPSSGPDSLRSGLLMVRALFHRVWSASSERYERSHCSQAPPNYPAKIYRRKGILPAFAAFHSNSPTDPGSNIHVPKPFYEEDRRGRKRE